MKGALLYLLYLIAGLVVAYLMWPVSGMFVFSKDENGDPVKGSTIVPSLLFGAATFFALYGINEWPKLSALFLALMLVLIAVLIYVWRKNGSTKKEFVCFTIITVILAAGGVSAVAGKWVAIIPVMVGIGAIGFYAYNALKYYQNGYTYLAEGYNDSDVKDAKAEAEEAEKKSANFGRLAKVAVAITVVALVFVGGLAISNQFGDDASANASTSNISNTKTKDTGVDSRFAQNWAKNENNRIDSEFLPKLLKKANNGKITEEIFEEVLLDDCAHDARILAIVANNLKLKDDTSYDNLLTSEKNYLSEEGKKLYFKVEGALATSNLLRTEVDSSGTNTGMNGNQYVVSAENGVTGELAGTKITTKDGKITFYILDRCANVVYPGNPPGNIPRGNTDNPPKPTPTPTPTPTPSYSKQPREDPVNQGNAQKGGGQNKPSDGAGEVQPVDPRTENPTGSGNDNNHGYSDPKTVTPSNPPVVEEHKSEPVVTDSNPMNYQPDPVTNRGPVDTSVQPTSPEGDGEFTPAD